MESQFDSSEEQPISPYLGKRYRYTGNQAMLQGCEIVMQSARVETYQDPVYNEDEFGNKGLMYVEGKGLVQEIELRCGHLGWRQTQFESEIKRGLWEEQT